MEKDIAKNYLGLLVDTELLENFRREAKTLMDLAHPNLVKVYDYLLEDDAAYLVTKYPAGMPLDNLLSKGKIHRVKALNMVLQICQGLEYAHHNQIIHGDLHPGNITLDKDKISITGFGTTIFGNAMLHTDFSPPERKQGFELDERSDIYSVGVILHLLLTGSTPARGCLDDNLEDDYRPVLGKCLAVDPSFRFTSLRELMSWIYKFLQIEEKNNLGKWQELIKKVPDYLANHRDLVIRLTSGLLMAFITFRWLDMLGGYQVVTARTIPLIIGLVAGVKPVLGIWLFWLAIFPSLWQLSKPIAVLEIGAVVTLGRFISRYPKQLAMLLIIPAIPDMGLLLPFIGAVLWGSRSGFVLGIWACLLTELGQLMQVSPVIGFIRLIPADWSNQGLAGVDWWQIIKTMANPLYWFWQPLIWGVAASLVGLLAQQKRQASWSLILPALAGVLILLSGYGLIWFYLQINNLATVALGAAAATAGLLCTLGIYLKRIFQQV
ncbi:MAG: serine/threonine-protein kinase [Thermincolia bacterium]